jgi:hypothetical protein
MLYENCYNLKFSGLTHVVRQDFKLPDVNKTINGIYRTDPRNIFNDDFLNLLETYKIYPTISVLFYTRPNHRGSPHIDGNTFNTGPLSINWNIGSEMILNYYKSDLRNQSTDYMIIKNDVEKIKSFSPVSPFLLRNDVVHSVDNVSDLSRWAITLRGYPKIDWTNLIDLLTEKQLIIEC